VGALIFIEAGWRLMATRPDQGKVRRAQTSAPTFAGNAA